MSRSASFRVPAERVVRKADLKDAIQRMLDHDGPYLGVMFPHQEHVLPMVPGGTFKDTITGDGRTPETKDMKTL